MERQLSGFVMETINESENCVEIFESISKMNLNKEQKALLFVVTQILKTTNKKVIINELEQIKNRGRIFPTTSFSDLIKSCLNDLNSSELNKLSQELIDFLSETENEEMF